MAKTSKGGPFVNFRQRFLAANVFFMLVAMGGTVGYYLLGAGLWPLWDCFYMTVVTISTVGFAEVLPHMNDVAGARAFTLLLILFGSGTLLYLASTFMAFVVEGDILGTIRRKRMQERIDKLSGHVVVCGAGATGASVVGELVTIGTPFVVIDHTASALEELDEELKDRELLYVVGEATSDDALERAGVGRAAGVICALTEDKDNLFVTVSARALNPKARIIAKSVESSTDNKLRRAGADEVVSPNRIGGLRMASELVRPHVTEFLDMMLNSEENLRLEEVVIPDASGLIGLELQQTNIRADTDLLVIACRSEDGHYTYNPKSSQKLEHKTTLIVLGKIEDIRRLREGIRNGRIGRR